MLMHAEVLTMEIEIVYLAHSVIMNIIIIHESTKVKLPLAEILKG